MTKVHQKVLKIQLKTVCDVSNIIKKYFLWVKSLMGKTLDSIFLVKIVVFQGTLLLDQTRSQRQLP